MNVMATIAKQFPGLVLLVGSSKSGKSYLLKYLLQYYSIDKPIFNFGLVLTGSYYNYEYEQLPDNAVHEYNEDLLNDYINQLKARKAKSRGGKLPASFLVLDDCLGLVVQSKAWRSLISTYRHLNITLFISVQYLKNEASSTLVREQTSVLFAFKSTNVNTIKTLYEYYGGSIFDNIEAFKSRFNESTNTKYACMVYIADNELQDKNKNMKSVRAPAYKQIKLDF